MTHSVKTAVAAAVRAVLQSEKCVLGVSLREGPVGKRHNVIYTRNETSST